VQNGFDRGLIGQGAGGIQQSSISRFGAPHVLRALLSDLWNVGRIIRSTLHETHSPSYFSSCTWCAQTEVRPHAAALKDHSVNRFDFKSISHCSTAASGCWEANLLPQVLRGSPKLLPDLSKPEQRFGPLGRHRIFALTTQPGVRVTHSNHPVIGPAFLYPP